MRLYTDCEPASITVADIAAEAQMTAAAVYYHYATKEDILLDGLSAFADALSGYVTSLLADEAASPADLPVRLLDWLGQRRHAATVWFTYNGNLGMAVEARRRITNEFLVAEILRSVRTHRPDYSLPHASVVAVGLHSAVEISASAWLVPDDVLVSGREDDFRREVAALGAKVLSAPAPVH